MPVLDNPRYERFAQARAKGARLDDAYEDAGFVLGKGHSSRLARRPEVAERIAELRAQRNVAEDVSPQKVIATLLHMAKAGEHRSASVVDLMIAATAAHHGLTVLHDDADYRTVARHAPDLSEHNIQDVN